MIQEGREVLAFDLSIVLPIHTPESATCNRPHKLRERGRATTLPKVWNAASIQPQICRECRCQAGNPERQLTLHNRQRSDLRTATQVREVEQLVLLEGFFECVAGLHLVNHPIQIGVVERGAPLLDFLHGGNEWFWFSLPRQHAQAVQIFLSE